MKKLALIIVLMLTACNTTAQIPNVNGVPIYGTAGAGHAQ
jgi:hypothetical protein